MALIIGSGIVVGGGVSIIIESSTPAANDPYFDYVSTLLSASAPASLPFNDDASTNNLVITVYGDTKPFNFNPYNPTGYYGVNFTAKTDYISIPATTALTTFTGDFTFEAWIYPSDTSITYWCMWDSRQSGATAQPMVFSVNPLATPVTGQGRLTYFNGSSYNGTGIVYYNRWTHIAFVRSGTTMTFYIDGVAGGTATISGTQTGSATTNPVYIGTKDNGLANYGTTGYISNFRIVNGTAVYTSNFTPSTSPLTAITNTVLLACQNNRYKDNSTNNYTLTPSSTTAISGFIPFTPSSSYSTYGSTYFDGNGDYMSVANNTVLNCGTGDFTLECWFYDDGSSTSYPSIFSSTDWTTGNPGISLRYNNTGLANKFSIAYYASNSTPPGGSGTNELLRTTNTYPTKTWHHVAFVRSGSTFSLYVNGARDGTTTSSGTYDWGTNGNGSKIGGGNWDGANSYIKGYVSNLRLVKGTALYTGTTYTVPATPLSAVANTSLLTCQTDQPIANNTFLDNSTTNLSITKNGNTTLGTFSPYGENYSVFFDGTGDFLSLPCGDYINYGTGDFTVEFWINTKGSGGLFAPPSTITTTAWDFSISGGNFLWRNRYTATTIWSYSAATATDGLWHHVAVARQSLSSRLFIDGSLVATNTDNNNWNGNEPSKTFTIGQSGLGDFTGYLSNVRFVKGIALYTSAFTPSTTPLQPVNGYTNFLICQSKNFVDNSASNRTLTANGNVSVQKFGPFAGTTLPTPYYSAYFDGNGDYLTIPDNSAWTIDTDYTIEFWLYSTSFPGQYNNIVTQRGGASSYWGINYDTSLGWSLFWNNGSGETKISRNQNSPLNTWVHIAVVKSGTTGYMFINGTQAGATFSFPSISDVSSSLYIGAWYTPGDYINGYLSNLRMVKGTAVYTTNFTPSTTPLTAIANTQLLTCQSATFIDNSTNNFTITAFGNSQPTTFNPFALSYSTGQSYTPTVFGGSMYFDGTGDYLTTAYVPAFANTWLGDGTVEAWVYLNSVANTPHIWSLSESTSIRSTLYVNGAVFRLYTIVNTGGDIITSTTTLTVGRWYHIAITRYNGTWTMWLNGISQGTSTSTNRPYGPNEMLAVGWQNYAGAAGDYFNGYISDLRIVPGQALYTSNFVPSNAPLTAVKNTVLLASGTSAGIYDSSEIVNFETVGDAKLSTTTVKFSGSTSMYFDGTGDYLTTPASPNLAFGLGDFTVELWVYHLDTSAYSGYFWGNSSGFVFRRTNTNKLEVSQDSVASILVSTGTISSNQWVHVAVTRSGTTFRLFINGTLDSSVTSSANFVSTAAATIGSISNIAGYYMNGYISDLRITKGYARYTATFTAPTAAFPTN